MVITVLAVINKFLKKLIIIVCQNSFHIKNIDGIKFHSLIAVVGQRLARVLCENCKKEIL